MVVGMDERTAETADNVIPAGEIEHPGASEKVAQQVWLGGRWREIKRPLVRELPLTIYVNKTEVITLLCTPSKLNCLVVGFLALEGIVEGVKDIAVLRVCEDDRLAEVTLSDPAVALPEKRTLTSGCGGGVAFSIASPKLARVQSETKVSAAAIEALVKQLQERAILYRIAGGVHTSALADPERVIVVAEDIGRHNTLDKIYGECLLTDVRSEGRILLTTGRVSSEMVVKATRMRAPIVISRTAPTDEAVRLAHESNVTLIGYARGSRMSSYTHPWRISDF